MMNKNQGFTIGAILIAGFLVRSFGTGPAETHGSAHASPPAVLAHARAAAETDAVGPWIASCNYWAAMSPFNPNAVTSHRALMKVDGVPITVTSEEDELGCANTTLKKWGFPDDVRGISVRAIIATIPDPVHTHLAITFDRTIAALLRAAQVNDYISSYYWVPWKMQPSAEDPTEPDEEPGHDPIRERQPGLLVLKSTTDPKTLLYVFLVGESPSEGINAFQIRNAFQYENYLSQILKGGSFARGRMANETSIVGPIYSGSALSLREAIGTEVKRTSGQSRTFHITGATSTAEAANLLGAHNIYYRSFDAAGNFTECEFFHALENSGYDLNRTAILAETSTLYAASHSTDCRDSVLKPVLRIPFPREISLLRNAQEESGIERISPFDGANVPSRFLHLTLRDSSPADSVPQFSRENTPLSQEARLMEIGRQLHRLRIQYVAIIASNPLDQIFLAQFLHRSCPDTRLFFYGSDLLMEREVDNVPFIGTISITPFLLMGMSTASAFPDTQSIVYYNAFSSQLWKPPVPSVDFNSEIRSHFQGYSPVTVIEDAAASTDLERKPQWQPVLWAATVGMDGYYPLAVFNPCTSNRPENAPAINANGILIRSSCVGDDHTNPEVQISFPKPILFPALLWQVVCFSVGVLCLAHTIVLLVANYWSSITRDLLVGGNDEPRRRAMCLNIAMAMLFSMACVSALPAFLIPVVKIFWAARALAAFTLAAALVTCIVSCIKTARMSGPLKIGVFETHTQQLPWLDRIVTRNIYFLVNLVAFATCIAIPWTWWIMCINNKGQTFTGLFFCYRCINPGSGVSPLVPVVLLLFGWYIWANCQTRRLRFSETERPRLPSESDDSDHNHFFIADEELSGLKSHSRCALFPNICCLFITRESLHQIIGRGRVARTILDIALFGLYLSGLIRFSLFDPIRSLNHFLWSHKYLADPYEILMGLLFFPLLMVSLAGWV